MTAANPDMSSAAAPTRERLTSVDVFRGITVAGMLLVNDPGDPAQVFAPLRHSVWNGWTPTDLVFPFFLFLVGITTHLSLSRRADRGDAFGSVWPGILKRATIIFAFGMLINGYPFYRGSAVVGPSWMPTAFAHVLASFAELRIMGVLQRIAIVYLVTSLIAWRASTKAIAVVATAILLAYWGAMTLLPVPGEGAIGLTLFNDSARTLSAWVDRSTLDWTRFGLGNHLWAGSVGYDPEGLFSTIPSVATALLGVLAGRWLVTLRDATGRLAALSAAGAIAMMIGAMWGWAFPINKPVWTSSYVAFTAGVACLSLGTIAWLVDVMKWDRWAKPFLVFGTNPILAYVGGELLARILHSSIKIKLDDRNVATETAVVRAFEAIGADPRVASMLWAVIYVLLWYAILTPLYKRRIFLKV